MKEKKIKNMKEIDKIPDLDFSGEWAKKNIDKLNYYLDSYEFLNKPRRVFTGLEILLEKSISFDTENNYSKETNILIRKIIKEANIDFYEHTFPKFEEEIKKLWKK